MYALIMAGLYNNAYKRYIVRVVVVSYCRKCALHTNAGHVAGDERRGVAELCQRPVEKDVCRGALHATMV